MSTNTSRKAGSIVSAWEDSVETAGAWLERIADRYGWLVILFSALYFGAHIVIAAARGLFG